MERLSAYVLTKNSELHLASILSRLTSMADEVLVVDSGSTDDTQTIAEGFEGVQFVFHEFENFKAQRTFAAKVCQYDMILFVDSDEIPDDDFVHSIHQLKAAAFPLDAYKATRHWNVLGKNVHCLYPVVSPDRTIRLYRKSKVSFSKANLVHETLYGFDKFGMIGGCLHHITFPTRASLNEKLEFYTDLAAKDLLARDKKPTITKILFSPIGAFVKWYFIRGGYKDGFTGLLLGAYAYQYTLKKYLKAKRLVSK